MRAHHRRVATTMRSISVADTVDAAPSAVWDVLADFPNISDWNGGVTASHATGDATAGVGATRHCDLAPTGALEETVREWEPQRKLVVSIDQARRLPMRRALATFTLEPSGSGTSVTIDYEYEPRPRLVGALLDRQLAKGFRGFLRDLGGAAQLADASADET